MHDPQSMSVWCVKIYIGTSSWNAYWVINLALVEIARDTKFVFVQREDSTLRRFPFLRERGILNFFLLHMKSKSFLLRKSVNFSSFPVGRSVAPKRMGCKEIRTIFHRILLLHKCMLSEFHFGNLKRLLTSSFAVSVGCWIEIPCSWRILPHLA